MGEKGYVLFLYLGKIIYVLILKYMLNREIINNLIDWKAKKYRKPLILKGARQIWKSYIVKEFWKKYFNKIHEINFQSNKKVHKIFDGDIAVDILINKLEYLLNDSIDIENDLLFFDEIQECPLAINSLKFFCEERKKLAIISAGSYLWLIKNKEAFPVWKVEFLSMFPLSFGEFLNALNKRLSNYYDTINIKNITKLDGLYHNELLEYLNLYFAIWWMPEIVDFYKEEIKNNNNIVALKWVRDLQNYLLESYRSDFSKYSWVVNSAHILSLYDSVSKQLSLCYDEDVNKFKFTWVIPKQKGFDRISWPLSWLSWARLVIKNYIVNKSEHPLKSYTKHNVFKLFFHDIWLLNASLDTPIWSIVWEELGIYKWFIAENFVAQELFKVLDKDLLSWKEATSEIEFLFSDNENNIIPVEVKSLKRSRRAKSLDAYIKKYSPKYAYKVTMQNYSKNNKRGFEILPMYLVSKIIFE